MGPTRTSGMLDARYIILYCTSIYSYGSNLYGGVVNVEDIKDV